MSVGSSPTLGGQRRKGNIWLISLKRPSLEHQAWPQESVSLFILGKAKWVTCSSHPAQKDKTCLLARFESVPPISEQLGSASPRLCDPKVGRASPQEEEMGPIA